MGFPKQSPLLQIMESLQHRRAQLRQQLLRPATVHQQVNPQVKTMELLLVNPQVKTMEPLLANPQVKTMELLLVNHLVKAMVLQMNKAMMIMMMSMITMDQKNLVPHMDNLNQLQITMEPHQLLLNLQQHQNQQLKRPQRNLRKAIQHPRPQELIMEFPKLRC